MNGKFQGGDEKRGHSRWVSFVTLKTLPTVSAIRRVRSPKSELPNIVCVPLTQIPGSATVIIRPNLSSD